MSYLDSSKDYRAAWGLNDSPSPDSRTKIPAFFNLEDIEDDEEVCEWLKSTIEVLQNNIIGFTRKAVENTLFYKGVQMDPNRDYYNFDDANRFQRQSSVSINVIYELVELWVNRMGKYKGNLTVVPSTNDSKARDNAEAKELALKDFFHKNNVNALLSEFDRHTFTLGEAYIFGQWDPDRGPLHPEFKRIKGKYKGLERVTAEGGNEVNVDRLPRIGDAALRLVPAIDVLFEDRPWEMLDYVVVNLPENVDKLRSDYSDVEIDGDGDIPCYYFFHLPTKHLPKGRFVKMASGEILENTTYPLSRPILPLVRMTNIDVIGATRAKSFIENIKSHQILINESISETWNNLRRSAKGKWVYPAKTVNPRHFHPQSPAVEYFGGVPPQFVSYDGIKKEAIQFIELLREMAEKQARVQGVSQGTPPPNVRSGLQFAQLEETEKRSVELIIDKKFRAIEQLGELVATIMSDNYKEHDGREVTIFGRDKEYLTQALKIDAIKEDHSVRMKSDEGLPTGKASQTAFYMDLRQAFGPNVVPDEMMIDMMDSGRFNQYTEFGGATVETTMAQISAMTAGKTPEPPEEHEDLVLKWKIVVGTMRKRAYLSYTDEVKNLFKDMVYAIEDLIINKKNKTPAMEERLQTLQAFPVFYKPPVVDLQAPLPSVGATPPNGAGPAEPMPDGLEEIPPELLEGADLPV